MNFRPRISKRDREAPTENRLPEATASRKSLKELKAGDSAQIVDFLDNSDVIKKIEAMGLRKGKKVLILKKFGRGIIVKANNSRIVLTSDVAKKIEVR